MIRLDILPRQTEYIFVVVEVGRFYISKRVTKTIKDRRKKERREKIEGKKKIKIFCLFVCRRCEYDS